MANSIVNKIIYNNTYNNTRTASSIIQHPLYPELLCVMNMVQAHIPSIDWVNILEGNF